jgi:hypothetical protein
MLIPGLPTQDPDSKSEERPRNMDVKLLPGSQMSTWYHVLSRVGIRQQGTSSGHRQTSSSSSSSPAPTLLLVPLCPWGLFCKWCYADLRPGQVHYRAVPPAVVTGREGRCLSAFEGFSCF